MDGVDRHPEKRAHELCPRLLSNAAPHIGEKEPWIQTSSVLASCEILRERITSHCLQLLLFPQASCNPYKVCVAPPLQSGRHVACTVGSGSTGVQLRQCDHFGMSLCCACISGGNVPELQLHLWQWIVLQLYASTHYTYIILTHRHM